MSVAAYKRTIREVESPRQIEGRVFARITGQLKHHKADWVASEGDKLARLGVLANGLRQALFDNRMLWLRLQTDLADNSNAMPPELRAQLLSLALWVDRACNDVIRGGDGLDALIDVNDSLIAGLSQTPAQATTHGPESHAETF